MQILCPDLIPFSLMCVCCKRSLQTVIRQLLTLFCVDICSARAGRSGRGAGHSTAAGFSRQTSGQSARRRHAHHRTRAPASCDRGACLPHKGKDYGNADCLNPYCNLCSQNSFIYINTRETKFKYGFARESCTPHTAFTTLKRRYGARAR